MCAISTVNSFIPRTIPYCWGMKRESRADQMTFPEQLAQIAPSGASRLAGRMYTESGYKIMILSWVFHSNFWTNPQYF